MPFERLPVDGDFCNIGVDLDAHLGYQFSIDLYTAIGDELVNLTA
jgi:hypothetical protein